MSLIRSVLVIAISVSSGCAVSPPGILRTPANCFLKNQAGMTLSTTLQTLGMYLRADFVIYSARIFFRVRCEATTCKNFRDYSRSPGEFSMHTVIRRQKMELGATIVRLPTHTWQVRDNFRDAADFVGWYVDRAHRIAGISKSDAYRHYLAYHEGVGGFKRGTFKSKRWLLGVARE